MTESHNPQGCRVTSPAMIALEYLSEGSPEAVADLIYKAMTTDGIREVMNRLFGMVDWDTRRATGQKTWADEMISRVKPHQEAALGASTRIEQLRRALDDERKARKESHQALVERIDIIEAKVGHAIGVAKAWTGSV